MKRALLVFALIAGGVASLPAWADHWGHWGRPRVHLGLVIGGPFYYPWYYGPSYPYYYGGPPVVVRQEPPVYIEKDQAGTEPDATQYWYYCPDSRTYYPYVKQCASPWQKQIPQAPAQ